MTDFIVDLARFLPLLGTIIQAKVSLGYHVPHTRASEILCAAAKNGGDASGRTGSGAGCVAPRARRP